MEWKDPEVLDRIEQAVAEAEKSTSAELVVVLTPQSGTYLDREMMFGVFAALVTLTVLVFAPVDFHPAMILPDFLLAFLIGTVVCNRFWFLKSVVATRGRREKNVRNGALVAFQNEGVGATVDRTGLLIYASVFERALRIETDFGIQGKVGDAVFNEILAQAGRPASGKVGETLVNVIEKAGKALSETLPPSGDNPDEIPNRPRVLR